MSKKEAIKHLQDAMRIYDLPRSDSTVEDENGRTISATSAYKVGYMGAAILDALAALGVPNE